MDDQRDQLPVSFLKPQDGWIEFAVRTTDEEFEEFVSYTPNDFVLELATALSLAMQGGDGVAVASCEPITYELKFSGVTATDMTHLLIVKYPDWKRNRKSACVELSFQATTFGIVLPFWRALRDLEGRVSATEYRETMRRDFPTSGLQRLSQLVSDHLL